MKDQLLFAIAHEAHMMGRIYNKMGEPEKPARVWCDMIGKIIEQEKKRFASQQDNPADGEKLCTCPESDGCEFLSGEKCIAG